MGAPAHPKAQALRPSPMDDRGDAPVRTRLRVEGRRYAGRRTSDTRAPAEFATRLLQTSPDAITMHAIEDKELSRLIDGATSPSQGRASLFLGAAFGAAPSAINSAAAIANGAAPLITDAIGTALGLVVLGVGLSATLEARRTSKQLRMDITEIRKRPLQEIRRSARSPG
jgi:hypothetical protein